MEITATRGKVTYDSDYGHVCTCTQSVFSGFDGGGYVRYEPTVAVDRAVEPTESGAYWYVCSRCGAGAWSGC